MIRTYLVFLLQGFIISSFLFAGDIIKKTTSEIEHYPAGTYTIVGEAELYNPYTEKTNKRLFKPAGSYGALSGSTEMTHILPPAESMTFRFDHATGMLQTMAPDYTALLTGQARAAVQKAPRWLQPDLTFLFTKLDASYQDKWAQTILDAVDPYIDEIAFAIAHSSPQYLASRFATPELFRLNAELIYENDQSLKYVEVVDYGSSTSDPDYYSTTRYVKTMIIDTSEVEVPRDIYYWYIVHPKITDEIPAFIDPEIIESNYTHQNNIVSPGEGEFWRDFFFYSTALGKVLKDTRTVWNGVRGIRDNDKHAIAVMTRWLDAVMTFTSNEERPHQPVRIYTKHIGRCGEYADMRTAIARTALIPCTNIATLSTDHTWNEFWDERWVHWDGGDLDYPLVYEKGWGKIHGSVFQIRSDGYLSSVSDTYSEETGTMTLHIRDSINQPVDGAEVYIYMLQDDGESLWFDNHGISDGQGTVSFRVGTRRYYYGRVVSPIGNFPEEDDELIYLRTPPRTGTEVNLTLDINGEKPVAFGWDSTAAPLAENFQYFLDIRYDAQYHVRTGRIPMDDMNRGGVSERSMMYSKTPGGTCDVFMLDSGNYEKFINGDSSFSAFNAVKSDTAGSIGYSVPEQGETYIVFANNDCMKNAQYVTAAIDVYLYHSNEIASIQLTKNYPNPFNRGTMIEYELPDRSHVQIAVFNMLGQKVKTLYNDMQYAGTFEVPWDGTNEAGTLVSSGIYLCRLKTDAGISVRKMFFQK